MSNSMRVIAIDDDLVHLFRKSFPFSICTFVKKNSFH